MVFCSCWLILDDDKKLISFVNNEITEISPINTYNIIYKKWILKKKIIITFSFKCIHLWN